jgi:hypothetical protein
MKHKFSKMFIDSMPHHELFAITNHSNFSSLANGVVRSVAERGILGEFAAAETFANLR